MSMKTKIKNGCRLLFDPDFRFLYHRSKGRTDSIPDEAFLKRLYRVTLGKELNLDNPRSFNEKLQWLKLHDYKPEYRNMVDKYEAKKYVADRIGSEYVIENYGVWEHFDDIDFDALPNQFVLKTTHNSGGVCICRDKKSFDMQKARERLTAALNYNWFWHCREYVYKDIKPRILAEKYMCDSDGDADNLTDYKIFCFHGEPKYIMTVRDRQKGVDHSIHRWYDTAWTPQQVYLDNREIEYEFEEKPPQLDKMLEIARTLSEGIRHLRVDLYLCDGKIYFGELTFYHKSGLEVFRPEEWDMVLGDLIDLKR